MPATAETATAAPATPALTEAAPYCATESTAAMDDGVELFYRAWLSREPARRAVLLFHRGHEHSARFEDLARELAFADDVAVFAWDARGHGRSPGERGYAESFARVVRDIHNFVAHISREHRIPLAEMVVLGHSVGAVAVAAWVHDYAPPIRAMVLATPALRVKLYVPLALTGLRALNLLPGRRFIKSYVRAKVLTHDAQQAKAYTDDPLISRNIAVNILLDVFDISTRLIADAGAITAPTMILTAGSDWVVRNAPTRQFFDRLSSATKEFCDYDGFYHAIFHEMQRSRVIADVRGFIVRAFERPMERGSLLDADKHGYTRDEFDRLSNPLSPLNPRNLWFGLQRAGMKTFCRLSEGVRLGWRTGFDSGRSLDYVYENRPRGITPLGKLIDRAYLNAIGWHGIRQRKIHLQRALRESIDAVRATGQRVRLLDIAAGPGRYAIEVLREYRGENISTTLRDHNGESLKAGARLVAENSLSDVTFEAGDAFDESDFASIQPRPNIVIVSGLYELFPDNELILQSLRGIASCIQPGGRLIYTGQPWHPQIEMIARVLNNREGQPWIMRRRTQAELDQLVASVGFEKIDTRIDRWGIFTVSTAIKCSDRA